MYFLIGRVLTVAVGSPQGENLKEGRDIAQSSLYYMVYLMAIYQLMWICSQTRDVTGLVLL